MDFDVPYARDHTRIIRHRSKQAKLSDINLTGMPGGGLDLWAATAGGVAALVSAFVVVPLWMWLVPLPAALAALPCGFVAIGVYLVVQRDTAGRDGPLVAVQQIYIRFLQPKSLTRLDDDKSPSHYHWTAIVLREPGARGPVEPVRQFREYGFIGDEPTAPVQGCTWPAAYESIEEWRYRVWWERGGELVENEIEYEFDDELNEMDEALLEGSE